MTGLPGWVLIGDPAQLPKDLLERARSVVVVPLSPEEISLLASDEDDRNDESRRLLELLVAGWPVERIARRLGVSRRTVDRRLAALRERYGASSTAELVALASRWGL